MNVKKEDASSTKAAFSDGGDMGKGSRSQTPQSLYLYPRKRTMVKRRHGTVWDRCPLPLEVGRSSKNDK